MFSCQSPPADIIVFPVPTQRGVLVVQSCEGAQQNLGFKKCIYTLLLAYFDMF